MAKTKPAKDKPAKAKAENPKREASEKIKPPKKKGGKERQPLNREERQKAAWLRKTERKMVQQTVVEVGAKASAGLTYDQLENPGLTARKAKPVGPTFEQTLLEVVAEQARQFEESAESVHLPMDVLEPEISVNFGRGTFGNIAIEAIEEPLGDTATCKVVVAEIRSLLEKTGAIFNAYHSSGSLPAAQLATGETFEKESESPLGLRLAEVIIADNPSEAIEEFLEETHDRILELQLIAGSFGPESELEKSAGLDLIDEAIVSRLKKAATEEAIRIDLSQRLAGLNASTGAPAEVDEAFATLIAESAQAAKAQRRERTAFRQTLREERGRRRFSKSPGEPDDEEFLLFLSSHRGESGVEQALLVRQIKAETTAAERSWEELKGYLSATAINPEVVVAQNATAMRRMLDVLAQLRALRSQLEELDKAPERGGDTEGASWINQLNLLSKRSSRGPRGMRHMLQQVKPLQPGKETADKEDLLRFSGRQSRSRREKASFAAALELALA